MRLNLPSSRSRSRRLGASFALAWLVALSVASAQQRPTPPTNLRVVDANNLPAPPPLPSQLLVGQTNVQYLGAFRLPANSIGDSTFNYAIGTMTLSPTRTSLFITGHPYQSEVAEVAIPTTLSPSMALSDLSTASVLQPFAKFDGGALTAIAVGTGSNTVGGGLLAYNGSLFGDGWVFYDANGQAVYSHWWKHSLNLANTSDTTGPYRLGTLNPGFVAGAMGLIDPAWQSQFGNLKAVSGQMGVNIITRTSWGPALIAFDPEKLGTASPSPGTPLVYYPGVEGGDGPLDHPLAPGKTTGPPWNYVTNPEAGIAWIGRSVLVVSRLGMGTICYGDADPCGDPVEHSKGWHGFPYVAWVYVYDAQDLVKSFQGQVQPWDVKPAAMFPLPSPWTTSGGKNLPLGVAYDPVAHLLYVTLSSLDDVNPLVNVFSVSQ